MDIPQDNPQGRPVVVRLDRVDKRYARGTLALSGLNLTIRESEFVSLLGPSGCGKSTVLRVVAGLTGVTSGEVMSPGVPPQGDAPAAPTAGRNGQRIGNPSPPVSATDQARANATERIGFVFQEPTLMPWANVADNVSLPLRIQHRHDVETRDRVAEALAMVGLENFAQAFPRELSGGMRMRVSIARAMITRPRLLLLDEPFAALDEISRNRLNDDLLRLWAEHGLTVVFVTHSVYESVYLSSRVVIMSGRPGRVASELPIDAPYPRDEQFRTSEGYGQLCRQVSAAMRAAQFRPPADRARMPDGR